MMSPDLVHRQRPPVSIFSLAAISYSNTRALNCGTRVYIKALTIHYAFLRLNSKNTREIAMKSLIALLGTLSFVALNFCQPAQAQTTGEIAKGNCKSCAEVCEKTLGYCTKKGGKYSEASVTNSLKDCITACKMTADFLNRGSVLLEPKACDLTVEACNECAKSMDKFNKDNEMGSCANECRKCVGNCQKLSSKK
jgi:hypothetical protein